MTTATPPATTLEPPDLHIAALVEYFNREHGGKITGPERDSEVLVDFLRLVPLDVPAFIRDDLAFSLVRSLDAFRKQAAAQWLH